MFNRYRLLGFILLLSASFSALAVDQSILHYSLRDEPRRNVPKKVLLLPVDIEVYELSAGGVLEKTDLYTKQAKINIDASLRERLKTRENLELVEVPSLSADEQSAVDEHLAMYDVVAKNGWDAVRGGGDAWAHKANHFDYTLGDGLKFLKEKTGADAALVVIGRDVMSSSGRKAMFIFAAALGVAIPMGFSYMTTGLVDLESGDLDWINFRFGMQDFIEPTQAKSAMENVLEPYPTEQAIQQLFAKK